MHIALEKLVRRYEGRAVLDLDRLEIAAGSFVGVRGANGSGKTTLLRLIAGLDRNYEGTILYDGEALKKMPGGRVVLVHQQPIALKRSLLKNLEYPLALQGINRAERRRRLQSLLQSFDLQALAHKRGDRLSGGETQKMALARALLSRPRLLLLDEPTAALDAAAVAGVQAALAAWQRETGATVLLVSHGEDPILGLAARIIQLEKGRIVSDQSHEGAESGKPVD